MFVAIVGDEILFRALQDDQAVRRQVMRSYRVGEWIDFMFDVSWSTRGSGSVDMYFKYANESSYRRVDTYGGPNMLANRPIDSTYLKWGNYKPLFDRTINPREARTILHDDIRVIPLD